MGLFNFYIKNWYYSGGLLFVALAFLVGFFGRAIDPLSKILLLSYMALIVHQFEEYAIPGGFPAVFNIAWNKEKEAPDRYPLNRKSAFVVNVVCAYLFYIIAIIFPGLIWLGLAQVLFGMAQLSIHGILLNRKMSSLYNSGLGVVLFLHWPIVIYYIWYVYANGLMQSWYWIAGIVLTLLVAVLLVNLPVTKLKDKNSKYPFSVEEMKRFNVKEKMAELTSKKLSKDGNVTKSITALPSEG
jgi:hypothetical protein